MERIVKAGSQPNLDSAWAEEPTAVDVDDLKPGRTIGEYEIEAPITAGGFGRLFRVHHRVLRREAAIKVLHRELSTSRELVLRFEREARAADLLRHPRPPGRRHVGPPG